MCKNETNYKNGKTKFAHLLHFEYKALGVANIEEEVANDRRGLAVDQLQARSESVVT